MRPPPRTWQRRISCFRRASTGWIPLLLLWLSIFGPARASGQNDNIMEPGPEALRNVQVYSASMYLQSDREAPSSVTVITTDEWGDLLGSKHHYSDNELQGCHHPFSRHQRRHSPNAGGLKKNFG